MTEEGPRPEETQPQVDEDADRRKLIDYVQHCEDTISSRKRERELNSNVEYPDESFFKNLDSKLKSCQGFLKKLKNITESQLDGLEKDFSGLNLSRYVSEATQALAEAKLKLSDIPAAVKVSQLFHRRYNEFATEMLNSWKRVLPLQKGEGVTNPSKLRVDMKFLPEQIAFGIIPLKSGIQLISTVLQITIDSDREDRALLPIISNFVKAFGFEFIGIHPKKIEEIQSRFRDISLPTSAIIPEDAQKHLRDILERYFQILCKQLESENQRLRDLEKAHRKLMESRGDVPQERLEKYDAHLAAFNKLHASLVTLADYLNRELPVLKQKEEETDVKQTIELLTVELGDRSGLAPIWNDEDERDFYESFPDLKATMPSMAFKDSLSEAQTAPSDQTSTEDAMAVLDAVMQADSTSEQNELVPEELPESSSSQVSVKSKPETENQPPKSTQTQPSKPAKTPISKRLPTIKGAKGKGLAELLDTLWEGEDDGMEDEPAIVVEEESDSASSNQRQTLETFLTNLQKLTSKDAVDKMAVDFCTNLNRRHYRKRLTQAIYNVPRNRPDLIPLYTRLVAILNPVMPELGTELVDAVRRQFRWLVKKQDPFRLESKIKCVRLIAELTKFGIFPKAETLLCFKVLLNNFKNHSVEMVSSLLEWSGRFLYWSPDSHSRMKVLLEELLRKKALRHFDARLEAMLENAYLACWTPESAARRTGTGRVQKVRTPMQLFIRKIFLEDLNELDPATIMSTVRRLPWDDPEVFEYGLRYLSSAWKVRYASIPYLAEVLSGIGHYQEDLAVRVIDNVLEDIRIHLELNNAKFNQRRLAMARYLGEMYNCRVIESQVVFNTLYSLVLFGWMGDNYTILDPPHHLFRLRLTCVILNTCGEYFTHGTSKKRLDVFLVLFRRYYWLKKSDPTWYEGFPFPAGIEQLVEETVRRLRRGFALMKSFEEADKEWKELCQKFQDQVNVNSVQEAVAAQESASSDYSSEGSRAGSVEDLTAAGDGETRNEDEEMEENEPQIEENPRPQREMTADDVDFMASFDKIMSETYQTQSQSKVPVFKSVIPSTVREQLNAASPGESGDESTIRVGLMTKKGAKQNVIKLLNAPEDLEYVSLWKAAEEHERQERNEMMRLTLDISHRQEREEYEEFVESTRRSLPGAHRPSGPRPSGSGTGTPWHQTFQRR